MTTYRMTTINNGTRIRNQPNTAGQVLSVSPDVLANVQVEGNEMFTAEANLSNSGGVYQMRGDIWVKVTHKGITGWMAYIHMGQAICRDFQVIEAPTDPTDPPVAVPVIPEYFDMTPLDVNGNPIGVTVRYKKEA